MFAFGHLFPLSSDLSQSPSGEHRQKATEIAQSLQGKDSQAIQEVLELYSKSSDIKGAVKGEMTQDKLEVNDNLPIDKQRQTASLVIEEREVQTKDGQTMTLQFLASMDLQKEAEDISLQFCLILY